MTHCMSDTRHDLDQPDTATRALSGSLDSLDLDPIKVKLMHDEEGEGWSRAHAEAVDIEYRRFLQLCIENQPGAAPVVPSKEVDTFWHYHILDTMKYAADCDAVFGRFLHHFPYFGLRGADDARNLASAAEATKAAYQLRFGQTAPEGAGAAGCGEVVCEVGSCHMVDDTSPQWARPRLDAFGA